MSRHARTRRELLAGTASAGTAADARRLAALMELEHVAADVYGLAARSGALSPSAHRLASALRTQEHDHAAALLAALGSPVAPRGLPAPAGQSPAQLQTALGRVHVTVQFDRLRSERDWFTLLENMEAALEGAYYEALAQLSTAAAGTLAARILASEAQHQTLLFRLRHPRDIPLAVGAGLIVGNAPPAQ